MLEDIWHKKNMTIETLAKVVNKGFKTTATKRTSKR
jgi:hypothetical protein